MPNTSPPTTHLTKDNALPNGQQLIEPHEDIVFVLPIPTIPVELVDVVGCQGELNLVGCWGNLGGIQMDVVGEGSREEDDLVGCMQEVVLDSQCLFAEPVLVEHGVCFIKDKDFDVGDVNDFVPHEVDHGAWCADDDLGGDVGGVFGEVVFDGVFSLDLCVFAHGGDDKHDLACKFMGGGEADGLLARVS